MYMYVYTHDIDMYYVHNHIIMMVLVVAHCRRRWPSLEGLVRVVGLATTTGRCHHASRARSSRPSTRNLPRAATVSMRVCVYHRAVSECESECVQFLIITPYYSPRILA